MKRNEIKFPYEEMIKRDGFLTRCMNAESSADQLIVDECAAKASTTKEFIDLYLAHEEEAGKQFYGELMKRERPRQVWYAVRHAFGDRQFKTESDVGSVKAGNDDFSIMIPNGVGDGITRVAVFENANDFTAEHLMRYWSCISGKFNIYAYDCGDEIIRTLDGTYYVYFYEGFVALVKRQ